MNLSSYLLAVIGICFLLQLMGASADVPFTEMLLFDPLLALSEPWRFVSSMFLHNGLMHLFFNSYALFMFGSLLERQISRKDYLTLFFGAGLVGTFLYYATYLLGIIPPIPALGASGAIFGILGAVAVLMPDLRIFFFFFPMKIRYAAILWVVLELAGTFDISSGVASAAHLGGLVFGLAFAWMIKRRTVHSQSWEWETEFR